MSIPVLILGEPGSGKTSSLRNFERGEIGVLQSIAKPLPFRNNLEVAASRDFDKIRTWLRNDRNHNAMMVDDFGYLITDLFMRYSHGPEKLRDQYEVYKIIGAEVYNFVTELMEDGRRDRIVYICMHIERNQFGEIEPATVGKMLNEKVKLIGMFTIALMAVSDGESRKFVTNGQPFKSPPGMFDLEIDNDLKMVDALIRDYWGLAQLDEIGGGDDGSKVRGAAA
ncbi:MAG: hypothetical protein IKL97_03545 [Eggerthellaceae bacterium]|nr:hypothetical protein [Eggerthellaceae bacterium]